MNETFQIERDQIRIDVSLTTTHIDAHSALTDVPRERLREIVNNNLQITLNNTISELRVEVANAAVDHA